MKLLKDLIKFLKNRNRISRSYIWVDQRKNVWQFEFEIPQWDIVRMDSPIYHKMLKLLQESSNTLDTLNALRVYYEWKKGSLNENLIN